MKRLQDADSIFNHGACNPSGIAHTLLEAMREIRDEPGFSTDKLCHDPAVKAMIYQLAHLCGMEPLHHGDQVSQALNAALSL